jgi:uncharacterized protein (TIGR02596 family)
MRTRSNRTAAQNGFSLVEILVVLGIVSVLIVAGAFGAKKSWESQEVRASALRLANDLTLASQLAMKLNRSVDVRFYSFYDPAISHSEPQFRGYQLLERMRGEKSTLVTVPLFEMQRFEGTTVAAATPKYSNLLGRAQAASPQNDPGLGVGDYSYTSIEFRPDGTTDLDPPGQGEPWTLTLTHLRWLDRPWETPSVLHCITVDWATGAVRVY